MALAFFFIQGPQGEGGGGEGGWVRGEGVPPEPPALPRAAGHAREVLQVRCEAKYLKLKSSVFPHKSCFFFTVSHFPFLHDTLSGPLFFLRMMEKLNLEERQRRPRAPDPQSSSSSATANLVLLAATSVVVGLKMSQTVVP